MIIPKEERLDIEVKAEQEKKYQKLGSYRPMIDGGKIFEYNISTGELIEAIYEETDIITLGMSGKRKLLTKKGCLYVEALNKKNAIKRMKRGTVILTT